MNDFDLLKEKWPVILEKIRQDHGLTQISYTSWFEPLKIQKVENGTVTFLVPDGIMAINILNKKYTLPIRVAIAEVTGLSLDIRYVSPEENEYAAARTHEAENAVLRAGLDPRYTFEKFVVGGNNKFANAAALAVAEAPGEIYNPLYLYADSGLGKTHLMQSICRFILENNPEMRVLYVTSEVFTNELIDAIRTNKTSEFRDKYRNIDVIAIDDIQFIIGKESTQEEFFHTFNTLYGAKKQIVISSDKPPKDLNILEERIMSRLEMGLIADISAPDYETRMAILRKKEEIEGIRINEQVREYIAMNAKSNIRILEGCINRIKAKQVFEGREVDLELAKQILIDIISPEKERIITTSMVIDVVCDHFNITTEELLSERRNAKLSYPRKIAMYLCRELTTEPYQSIAMQLNRKDHTTVISAVKSIEKEMEYSDAARRDVDVLRKKLKSNI